MLKGVRKGSDAKDVNLNDGSGDAGAAPAGQQQQSQQQGQAASQEKAAAPCESGSGCHKPKTSQSDTAHGSFFLRMGTLGKVIK